MPLGRETNCIGDFFDATSITRGEEEARSKCRSRAEEEESVEVEVTLSWTRRRAEERTAHPR